MKRIGLVIFLTILVGLILNISLILTFKALINPLALKISILIVNSIVLGYSIWLMKSNNCYLSHIVVLAVVYLIISIKIVTSLYFVDFAKEAVYIEVQAVVKDVKEYTNTEYKIKIKSVNEEKLFLKKNAVITDFSGTNLEIGDEVVARVKVQRGVENYSLSKACEVSGTFVEYVKVGKSFTLKKYFRNRQNTLKAILDNELGGKYSDIVGAFLIGSTLEDISSKDAMITSGIYHIMAISGLHIGILSGILLYILNLIFYRRTAQSLTILLLFIYGFLTGFSFSTTRAVLVVTIALVGRILNTQDDNLNTVSLVGGLILVNNPLAIFNAGFVYSFTVVFGLILTTPTIQYGLKIIFGLSLNKKYILVDYFSTIITAQLYFVPISLYYFGNLYIYSLFVNALVIFIVPTLFVSSLGVLIFYGTFISSLFGTVVKFLVDYILLVANFFNELPMSEIVVGQPKTLMLLIYYVVLFGVSYYATKNIYEVNNGHFRKTEILKEW